MSMIRVNRVDKYFNKGKKNQIHVINNTSLDFAETGLIALLGPSGSGKTTLLNAMGGLDRVNSGDIFVNGDRITNRKAGAIDKIRNLNIGYIFQDYKLVDSLTVTENVAMVLRMIGIKDKSEIDKRVNYVLKTLGIYRYRNRLCNMLSGGERQRVGIARAIVKDPKIIIADEPTGNLDSANTIEIMNIIKSISENRLVILVTHEVDLAKFYASRIIELKDGVIEKDYENVVDNNLNYKIDNKIYLKDFETRENISQEGLNIQYYGSKKDKLNLSIVVRDGNIYIKTEGNERVEVINSDSKMELVDDHYKEIDKSTYENYKFDFSGIINKDYKEKYSSIFKILPSIGNGFKHIKALSKIKKVLLVGFLIAALFITYSFSTLFASFKIDDSDFVTQDRDYISFTDRNMTVTDYESMKKISGVDYIIPRDGIKNFTYVSDSFYQTNGYTCSISGGLVTTDHITLTDLILGRMPKNQYEIIVDKYTLEKTIDDYSTNMMGINDYSQFIDCEVTLSDSMKPFKIVGITDKSQPVIYIDKELLTDALYYGSSGNNYYYDEADTKNMMDCELFDGYKLAEGTMPKAYEVLIPVDAKAAYKIGSEIKDLKIGDVALKVSGYYEMPKGYEGNLYYLVNKTTLEYSLALSADSFLIYPTDGVDSDVIIGELTNMGIKDADNLYDAARKEYILERAESVKSNFISSLIVMIISLIEIFLMTRSSFMSRIKEIGIYRAIGVKKIDIYKLFSGEIIATTVISSIPGIAIMAYILYNIAKIKYLSASFVMNPLVILISFLTILVFNLLVGLIPAFATMRKTPAAILARYDVD